MFLNMKKVLNKFQNKKNEYNTALFYIKLKWKLQIEKIEDPTIWAKFIILKKLSVTYK